jgi:integrase
MARTTHRLTAVQAANLKDKGVHLDGAGLYLKIAGTGTKSWIFRFSREGRTRDMGLGAYPGISLAAARRQAGGCRELIGQGIDPIEARKVAQAEQKLAVAKAATFLDCAEQLIASHEAGWRNAKHRQQWRKTLSTYAYPTLGTMAVARVDTELVLKVLQQPIEAKGKKIPLWNARSETAFRLRGRIEAVLSWAKARGMRSGANPAQWRGHLDQLLPARSKVRRVRHHPALPYVELSAFMAKLREQNGVSAKALAFCILTASRTLEVIGARWVEIEGRMWTVPAERMKAAKQHRVPLSLEAMSLLDEMAAMRTNEFVFPGWKNGKPLSDKALLVLLRYLHPGITVHGFRSSFRDWAAETTNFPNHVVEMALAHAVGDKVEAAYRRGDLFEKRRKLMEAWSAYCVRDATTAKVVPLKRREG